MRVVVQRSKNGQCLVDGKITGEISFGYVLLIGFTHDDTEEISKKMAKKIANLRIFEDENGKLNHSILDVGGQILAISQFTLYANPYDGNRPGFTEAMAFNRAETFYLNFVSSLRVYGIPCSEGIFGADMGVSFTNDGPVTILLDSSNF